MNDKSTISQGNEEAASETPSRPGRKILQRLCYPADGVAPICQAKCDTASVFPPIASDPDRLLFFYPEVHYDFWKSEIPEQFDRFKAGLFGENLSAYGLVEEDVCIGDKVRIGSALFQVTQPFAPDYELNLRLNHPSIARKACEAKKTGWYYRILEHGRLMLGDDLEIVERPHPEWTVAKVLHFLFEVTTDRFALEVLSELEPMGVRTRKLFKDRLAQLKPEFDQLDKLGTHIAASPALLSAPANATEDEPWITVLVRGIIIESPTVRSFYLVSPTGERLPKTKPGAHIKVKLPNGMIKHYSLCNNSTGDEYHIAVGLNPASAGGSIFLHEQVRVGDALQIAAPINTFPVDASGEHHIMIAGGIGITPFLAMIDHFERSMASYELHFCTKSQKDTPFYKRLSCLPRSRITFHHDGGDPRNGIDLKATLSNLDSGTHIYCCGPGGLMRAVEAATVEIERKRVHFESFISAPDSQSSFKIKIESTGQVFLVGTDQTILQVLRNNGIKVESQCEAGSCGTCVIRYSQGDVLHKDFALSPEERKTLLTSCVSRAASDTLTLRL